MVTLSHVFRSTFFLLLFAFDVVAQCPEWITIYVHGTTTAVGLKFLSKFCKEVTFGAPGLHHLAKMPDHSLLCHDVELLQKADPNHFTKEHFYTFGWSGKLSFIAREQAGKKLHREMVSLLKKYKKKYGKYPKVRVMTFSHGGNVALNMVNNLPFFKNEHVYLELLLIACPVQKPTEYLIDHDEIDKSYIVSSNRDLLQVVDFYKHDMQRQFPDRFFHTQKSNCVQILVKVNDRGLGHIDLLRSFMVHLPYTLRFADTCMNNRCEILNSQDGTVVCCDPVTCSIQDDKFIFFNGFNLVHSVYGKRKR